MKWFEKDKAFINLTIALLLGIYYKLTGNLRPFVGYIVLVTAIFAIDTLNTVLGKVRG